MIRNQSEYREAIRQAEAGRRNLVEHRIKLEAMGLKPDEVECYMRPVRSMQERMESEVARFECLKRGDLELKWNLENIGQLLVEARIARGLTQRALAAKLGVHESMVSRDERNEYHGVSVDRARQILDAIGIKVLFHVELPAKVERQPVRHVAFYASFKPQISKTPEINFLKRLKPFPNCQDAA